MREYCQGPRHEGVLPGDIGKGVCVCVCVCVHSCVSFKKFLFLLQYFNVKI